MKKEELLNIGKKNSPLTKDIQTTEDDDVVTESKKKKKFWEMLLFLALSCFIGFAAGRVVNSSLHPYMVSGSSMYPTLKEGWVIKCTSDLSEIKRGDIVVFKEPLKRRELYVKRVIGIPGDVLSCENGHIIVNGEMEPYNVPVMDDPGMLSGNEIKLNEDEYFCVGDNRNASYDCRVFGPVRKNLFKYIYISTLFSVN